MKEQYLEVGKITNVHGIMGEVRVQPWADSPDFLCQFKTLYVDSSHWPIQVERARVHKNMVILKLQGVTDVNSALAMRNAVLYIDRKDVQLPEGSFFLDQYLSCYRQHVRRQCRYYFYRGMLHGTREALDVWSEEHGG